MVEAALDWAGENEGVLVAMGVGSLVMFFGSLAALPWVVGRLPADYFAHERRPPSLWADRPAWARWSLRIGKNALGVVLILGGIIMLAAPGQGLLTIAVGLVLLDFPGKYRLERRAGSRPRGGRALNWLRRRRGKPDFEAWSGARG